MKNRLAVFIHGLGSTHEKTWAKMLRLCSEDKILSSEYDFDYFEYHTSKWADFCREGIPKLALMLDSKVNADWQSYESIFFVAHSMGGIVAKQYILDLDTFSKGSNVKGIFFFATPSNGSTLASIADFFNISSSHTKDLIKNSSYLTEMNKRWESRHKYTSDAFQYAYGEIDSIVTQASSHRDYYITPIVIPKKNHGTISVPDNKSDISYKQLKSYLLEQTKASIKQDSSLRVSTSRLPTTEGEFFGREAELGLMEQVWNDRETNIISVVAFGGVGKTALVKHWLNHISINGYTGASKVYGWSFYSQGAEEGTQVSAEEFFAHTLKWFGDPDPSAGSPWDKGVRLAELIQKERTLLILDGMEPLQYPPGPMFGKLKDQGLKALTRELRRSNPGLCVITTRVHLVDIADTGNQTVRSLDLENLTEDAGAQFLHHLGVKGTKGELKQTVINFGGHALALSLLGRYLAIVHNGNISMREIIPALTKEEKLGGHARRVMESYEKWLIGTPELDIIRMMGLFDRPATGDAIESLKKPPEIVGLTDTQRKLSWAQWKYAVSRLRELGLLGAEDGYHSDILDCHPLVREHFQEKLKNENPNAWIAANSKLYEYYRDIPNKTLPDTLVEMEPLFLAVSHGCKANKYQEAMAVYWERIQRKSEYYSLKVLGALGANLATLADFFDTQWDKPVDNISVFFKLEVLGSAGYILRALGQKQEAIQALRGGLIHSIRFQDWNEAATNAENISELHLSSGDILTAIKYGKEAIEYADKSREDLRSIASRTALADALHRNDQINMASTLFLEAELLQQKWQPKFKYLYSLRGFLFCDLLLKQEKYTEALARAETTINIAIERNDPLSIALDNLTLGRANIYRQSDAGPDFKLAKEYFDKAVDGLRMADRQDHIARSLIFRAAWFRKSKDYNNARNDLDEAFEISKSGDMQLHLVDFYLESAHLHLVMDEHEEANKNIALAEDLINKTGYDLKRDELEALKGKRGSI